MWRRETTKVVTSKSGFVSTKMRLISSSWAIPPLIPSLCLAKLSDNELWIWNLKRLVGFISTRRGSRDTVELIGFMCDERSQKSFGKTMGK